MALNGAERVIKSQAASPIHLGSRIRIRLVFRAVHGTICTMKDYSSVGIISPSVGVYSGSRIAIILGENRG